MTSAVFLSFWGSEEHVVLPGVQDLYFNLLFVGSDCGASLFESCRFVMQRLVSEAEEKVLFQ